MSLSPEQIDAIVDPIWRRTQTDGPDHLSPRDAIMEAVAATEGAYVVQVDDATVECSKHELMVGEAYQIFSRLLEICGLFETPDGQWILDYFSEGECDQDILHWPRDTRLQAALHPSSQVKT